MDFDWGHHHVIYHGWDRPGWVNNARPYVHVRDVYINRSRRYINHTWIHDRSHGGPASYLATHPSGPNAEWHTRTGEVEGRTAIQPRPAGGMFGPRGDTYAYSGRGRESRGIAGPPPAPLNAGVNPRPNVPTPAFGQQPAVPPSDLRARRTMPAPEPGKQPSTPAPTIAERPVSATPRVSSRPSSQPSAERREGLQPGRTPSVAFGGYRGANEARQQSVRGQASRQSAERMRPTGSAEGHARAPAGGNAQTGRQHQQR